MISPIQQIRTIPDPSSIGPGTQGQAGASFSSVLGDVMDRIQSTRQEANDKITALLSGDSQDIHQVAIASQKADLTFELAQQVRSKMVQAYQEVMRTQL